MYETFENLPESKKNHILQVCIEEFAMHGYEKASTNTIVKRLGISKGVLFLYFKNKKNLYLYLIDRITESLTNKFMEKYFIKMDEKYLINEKFLDIFDHLADFYRMTLQEDPYAFKFMLDAFLITSSELKKEVEARHSLAHEMILEKINMDNFRKDVDLKAAIDLLHMIFYHVEVIAFKDYEGRPENIVESLKKCSDLTNKYIRIIRYGIYES